MKHMMSKMFIFTAGAMIGSVVTYKFAKNKFDIVLKEEMDAMVEAYGLRSNLKNVNEVHETDIPEEVDEDVHTGMSAKPSMMEYIAKIREAGYVNYSDKPHVEEEEANDVEEFIHVIDPDDFEEDEDYDSVSLTYYADGILADDMDERIEDVDDTVGPDFADHFGEYEDDAVFIKNDKRKTYYEILRDERRYAEVVYEDPHPWRE